MLLAAVQHNMDDIQPLVKTLICESECTTLKSLVHGAPALTNQGTDFAVGPLVPAERGHTCSQMCLSPLQWSAGW